MIAKAVVLLALLCGTAFAQPPSPSRAQKAVAALTQRVRERNGQPAAIISALGLDEVAAAPAPESPALLVEEPLTAADRRKLLGTMTINIGNGATYAWQGKITAGKAVNTDESGQRKVSRAFAAGSALAVNDRDCLKTGTCTKPVAEVDVAVEDTASPITGLTATANAVAQGDLFNRVRTNTGSLDIGKNLEGRSVAISSYSGSSSSSQFNMGASASSEGRADALAGFRTAVTTQTGSATALPQVDGDYGWTDANVDVNGWSWVAKQHNEQGSG